MLTTGAPVTVTVAGTGHLLEAEAPAGLFSTIPLLEGLMVL